MFDRAVENATTSIAMIDIKNIMAHWNTISPNEVESKFQN